VAGNLRALLDDLRAFSERHTVVELAVAFALASAVVSLAGALVSGLVISPITQSRSDFGVSGPLSFVIGGRVVQTQGILGGVLLVAVIAVASGVLVRSRRGVLWQEAGEYVECPYCLSDIPARARVCAQCTRDLPSTS